MIAGLPPSYPPQEAHAHGWLPEEQGHRVYWEQSGNPAGTPVVVVHGGPGSGSSPAHRRFFDPAGWRIVQLDQRGCGRSAPRGELRHNTTDRLVADMERLRAELGIARWLVVGGSWGAALALAYAARHRAACLGLILRGTFLTGRQDLEWFFGGAAALLPDAWQEFLDPVPRSRRHKPLDWYQAALNGTDRTLALAAVRHWMAWENALGRPGLTPIPAALPKPDLADLLLDKYRLQAHYLQRRCFLGEPALLDCAARIHGLPTLLLHGRLDLVCRPANAWRVHRTLAGSHLVLVEGAGHDPFHPAMAGTLVAATDHFLRQGDFNGFASAEDTSEA